VGKENYGYKAKHGARYFDELLALPEVVDAMHLTGRFDYQVRLRCASIDALDQLLRNFKEQLGVSETVTRLVLSTAAGYPRQPAPSNLGS
jgi:Lrp/AsnC family leucine-responsive transcriptional regulator